METNRQQPMRIKGDVKKVSGKVENNIQYICKAFNLTEDLKTRKIRWQDKDGIVIYLETMVDSQQFQNSLLIPLAEAKADMSMEEVIAGTEFNKNNDLNTIIKKILAGNCALFLEQEVNCYLFNSTQTNHRSPDEPDNEKTVRGSHQGFVEDLDVNLNILRNYIKNKDLTVRFLNVGFESNTRVAIIYMNNIANPTVVEEVQKRVQSITTDMAFTPGYLEECLEDVPFSPFKQNSFYGETRSGRSKFNGRKGGYLSRWVF